MKRFLLVYALGLTLIVMPCCTKSREQHDNSTAAGQPAGIVATIGSASLTTEDLTRALNTMTQTQQFEYLTDEGKRVLIEMLIDWKLLSQEAVKAGLEKDKAVKVALKNTSGSTNEREEVLGSAYLRYRIKQIERVTDAEAEKYYLSHPAEFAQPARIRVQRILSDSKEQAQQALAAIKQGATFEQYKQTHPQSKIRVDTLWLQHRENGLEMESAAFKLTGSELSDILQVSAGWCLLRVDERVLARNQPLEEVRESLRARLHSEQYRELVENIRRDLRRGMNITINKSVLASYQCKECAERSTGAEMQDKHKP
jgi:peptidyl-prolyl cis-trans isomerase C